MYRYLTLIVLLAALVMGACSSDDAPEVALLVTDLSVRIPNEPEVGTQLGFIEATTSNNSTLQYRLVSESVSGAFNVDASTGRVTVADASAFDFEENPSLSATVEVMAGDLISAAAIGITLDELNSFQLQVVEYFKEIALGFEFGGASQVTRKWRGAMNVFVGGTISAELQTELDLIVSELEELISDDFKIQFVPSAGESNYYLFLGSANDYANLFPASANFVASNWGLFTVDWDDDNYLNTGHMYVDIERANEVEQRHLLREEFTQSLGLARDSQFYPNSIFQADWTRTTEYTEIDKELIRLLYHPDMDTGLNSNQIDALLRDILTRD